LGFLMLVEDEVCFGRKRLIAVTLGGLGLSLRSKPSRDVGREHRKGVQQRVDQTIKRRRACEASVQGFVPCHGQHYHSGFSTHSLKAGRFFILWNLLRKRWEWTRHNRLMFSESHHQYGPQPMSFRAEQRSCADPEARAALVVLQQAR
jgi:hypothetical protein